MGQNPSVARQQDQNTADSRSIDHLPQELFARSVRIHLGAPLLSSLTDDGRCSQNEVAMTDQLNFVPARSRAWKPILLRSSALFKRKCSASEIEDSRSGSTRIPVTPSSMASGTPPFLPPIAGFPESAASINTIPNPSQSLPSHRRLGNTNTSHIS